jgi:dihydrofolate reductase
MGLLVTQFMSIDGVIEAPGNEKGYAHGGWVGKFQSDDWLAFKLAEAQAAQALLLGRKTYEGFAAAWPHVQGPFGDQMNAIPKYVVSATLNELSWNNSHLISTDLVSEVAKLKEMHPGTIEVHGSHSLINGLFELDLIDDYHLMVFPVVLGSGMRLFDHHDKIKMLDFKEVKSYGAGVNLLHYSRSRS